MTVTYYKDIAQHTQAWLDLRLGTLTGSEMKLIITPKTLQYSKAKEVDAHLAELAAQRINKYAEPSYQSWDMLRGLSDEPDAKTYYEKHYAKIEECGFVTNDEWGFTLGFSPDGLVGEDGLVEAKSRKQHFQFATIVENKMPDEYSIQVQTGLLISKRKWCDFISYSGGMFMCTIRVMPDTVVQEAIIEAAKKFHENLDKQIAIYQQRVADKSMRLIPTERKILDKNGDIVV